MVLKSGDCLNNFFSRSKFLFGQKGLDQTQDSIVELKDSEEFLTGKSNDVGLMA